MSDTNEQLNPNSQQPDLNDELSKLGSQLERALRRVLMSDPAKTFQRDISTSIGEIGKQFQQSFQSINQNQDMKNFAEQGQNVINQVQDLPIVNDFRKVLATGVSQLNQQIDQFINSIQEGEDNQIDAKRMQSILIEEE